MAKAIHSRLLTLIISTGISLYSEVSVITQESHFLCVIIISAFRLSSVPQFMNCQIQNRNHVLSVKKTHFNSNKFVSLHFLFNRFITKPWPFYTAFDSLCDYHATFYLSACTSAHYVNWTSRSEMKFTHNRVVSLSVKPVGSGFSIDSTKPSPPDSYMVRLNHPLVS